MTLTPTQYFLKVLPFIPYLLIAPLIWTLFLRMNNWRKALKMLLEAVREFVCIILLLFSLYFFMALLITQSTPASATMMDMMISIVWCVLSWACFFFALFNKKHMESDPGFEVVFGLILFLIFPAWVAMSQVKHWRATHRSAESIPTHASALAMPVQAISQPVLPEGK